MPAVRLLREIEDGALRAFAVEHLLVRVPVVVGRGRQQASGVVGTVCDQAVPALLHAVPITTLLRGVRSRSAEKKGLVRRRAAASKRVLPCPAWAPPSNRAGPARTFPQMKVVVADPLAIESK